MYYKCNLTINGLCKAKALLKKSKGLATHCVAAVDAVKMCFFILNYLSFELSLYALCKSFLPDLDIK